MASANFLKKQANSVLEIRFLFEKHNFSLLFLGFWIKWKGIMFFESERREWQI